MFPDFSTPESALGTLEDAYKRKDLNAAVAAKDFICEARAMLMSLENLGSPLQEGLVIEAAEVLELAFRKQIQVSGFPDFSLPRCQVVPRKELHEDLVELVEECIYPSGGRSRQVFARGKESQRVAHCHPAATQQFSHLGRPALPSGLFLHFALLSPEWQPRSKEP